VNNEKISLFSRDKILSLKMETWHLVILFGGLAILTGAHAQVYGWFGDECPSFPVVSLLSPPMAVTILVALFCFASIATDADPRMSRYLGLFTIPVLVIYDLTIGMLFLGSAGCSTGLGVGLLVIAMGYFLLWQPFYFLGINGGIQLEYEMYEEHLRSEKKRIEDKLSENVSENVSEKV